MSGSFHVNLNFSGSVALEKIFLTCTNEKWFSFLWPYPYPERYDFMKFYSALQAKKKQKHNNNKIIKPKRTKNKINAAVLTD
jgi:hypothetical protein